MMGNDAKLSLMNGELPHCRRPSKNGHPSCSVGFAQESTPARPYPSLKVRSPPQSHLPHPSRPHIPSERPWPSAQAGSKAIGGMGILLRGPVLKISMLQLRYSFNGSQVLHPLPWQLAMSLMLANRCNHPWNFSASDFLRDIGN